MKQNYFANIDTAPLVDLHTHSSCSDGMLTPAQLVAQAIDKQLVMLALTDHDTTDGVDEAITAAASSSITIIPGVEISSYWDAGDIHITGLGIDHNHPVMVATTEALRLDRQTRTQKILHKLSRCNLPDAVQDITSYYGRDHLSRSHFARYLVKLGCCRDQQETFDRYLGRGKPAFVRSNWIAMEDAISSIKASGGIAVLAHPHRYNLTAAKLSRLLALFHQAGGEGMEVEPIGANPELRYQLLRQLAKHNLIGVWGSDYHGLDRPYCQLGRRVALAPELPSILDDERIKRYVQEQK